MKWMKWTGGAAVCKQASFSNCNGYLAPDLDLEWIYFGVLHVLLLVHANYISLGPAAAARLLSQVAVFTQAGAQASGSFVATDPRGARRRCGGGASVRRRRCCTSPPSPPPPPIFNSAAHVDSPSFPFSKSALRGTVSRARLQGVGGGGTMCPYYLGFYMQCRRRLASPRSRSWPTTPAPTLRISLQAELCLNACSECMPVPPMVIPI
jgi:hypothetical protein